MIEEVKEQSIIYKIFKIIFAILFSGILTIDRVIEWSGDIFGAVSFNVITNKEIVFFIYMFIITILAIDIINIILKHINKKFVSNENNKKKWWMLFVFTAIIIVLWLPYILTYFPGGIYSDTTVSISQARGESELTNHHPMLYTLLIRFFITISNNNLQIAMNIFTIVQIVTTAMVFAYFVYFLYKINVSKLFYIPVLLFFGIYRIIPLFTISIWKDVWFCNALMLYSILILETIYTDARNMRELKNIIKYIVLMFLVSFLRNNGIYVVILTTIILLFVYRKNIKIYLKLFSVLTTICVILMMLIRGPVYKAIGISKDETVESVGVLLQQMTYVAITDGNLNEEQRNFIEQICPIDTLKVIYAPCTVDKIKGHVSFNSEIVNKNQKTFLIMWLKIGMKNPIKYTKAFLMETLGFWDVNKASFVAYVQPSNFSSGGVYDEVIQNNYLNQFFGLKLYNKLYPKQPVSHAIFFWIMMLGIINIVSFKKYKYVLVYIPSLVLYTTLLMATPIAFSLRYIYILVMMLPFAVILPMLNQPNKLLNEKNK